MRTPLHMNLQVANFQRVITLTFLEHFFQKVQIELSLARNQNLPSTPAMSETAACAPSPVADHPLALPSPTSSPSSCQ